MTAYAPTNIRQFASTRETSVEIALAIFEIAAEGDENRMWAEPTEEEVKAVEVRAWELADADEDRLHWGCETIKRPQTTSETQQVHWVGPNDFGYVYQKPLIPGVLQFVITAPGSGTNPHQRTAYELFYGDDEEKSRDLGSFQTLAEAKSAAETHLRTLA